MTLKSQRLNKILFFVCHTPVCVCVGGGESGSSGIRSRGDAGSFPPVAPPSSRSSELSPFGRQTKKKDAHTQERFWGKRTVLKAACVSDFCPPAIAWVTWPRDCEGDQAYSSRMPKRWTNTQSRLSLWLSDTHLWGRYYYQPHPKGTKHSFSSGTVQIYVLY